MATLFNGQRVVGVRLLSDGAVMHNQQPVIGIRSAAGGLLFSQGLRTLGVDVLGSDKPIHNTLPTVGAVLINDARTLYNGSRVLPAYPVSGSFGGANPSVVGVPQVAGVTSANPTIVTFTIPAAAVPGDVLIVCSASRENTGTSAMSIGTKLGQVDSVAGSNYAMAAFRYTVQGGDTPGVTTFTTSHSSAFTNFSAICVHVKDTGGVEVSAGPGQFGGFDTTPDAPSVTTISDNALVLFFVGQPTTNTYSSGSYTELVEAHYGGAGLAAYAFTKTPAGATGMLSVLASGSHYNYGATVALA